jgi:hypothetical protein
MKHNQERKAYALCKKIGIEHEAIIANRDTVAVSNTQEKLPLASTG